jgi:RNA polymerase sigma-70 factor, ECF subfamily
MTRNQAEAEDLTQEVFVQLLRKIDTFRGESLFTTWLYRLTVNQVLMHIRHAKYRKELQPVEGPLDTSLSLTSKPSSGSHVIERIALETALSQLPSGCKSVFLMYDIEGYKHHEIANAFGCSVGNSKSQLHKARKKLRQLLKANT